ncbi:ABC-type amino acid transport substrate-binding protein [Angulomicrobium tetraedrale]|uniref:ABC-type amino acid transport substrate-binding protein n=1 Tax=Ancylobacter tetraedralis TaxID=217068 RepID=A0A839ZE78_9HYPH|nr:transporter substrate-binding domain-containing protein [Ancylobacter tetraedralis]MBB3773121.1 ABC-type amino acid transport substrate-binding protein [Ancylobacter tetraedralis]
MHLRWVLALLLLLALGVGASAQQAAPTDSGKTLKVGVYVEPPFVEPGPNGYRGLAVELWEWTADRNELDFAYQALPTIHDLLQAAEKGEIDVAVAPLTITEDRLKRVDFTQPWFNGGLRVMIEESRSYGIREILRGLVDAGHVRIYLWIAAIVFGATVLLTAVDRHFDQDFPRRWHEGMAESFYHVMSVATSGKAAHKQMFGVFGRILAALWMVCGVTLVAYVTSSITTVMTTNALTNQIAGFSDLNGKTVGVLKGSVAEAYSRDRGIGTVSYGDLPQAVQGLLGREVSALVGDAAALEFYDRSHPQLPITEVGGIVHREMLGFALPQGSPLVHELSLAIIAATEEGLLDRLRLKYLGSSN